MITDREHVNASQEISKLDRSCGTPDPQVRPESRKYAQKQSTLPSDVSGARDKGHAFGFKLSVLGSIQGPGVRPSRQKPQPWARVLVLHLWHFHLPPVRTEEGLET